jgi:CheY-like chemotaxis protein
MTHKKNKILIVDDEEYVRKIIQLKLEEEGFHVDTAHDEAACLSKVQSFQPDLILMDLMLENCSGLDTVKILKKDLETKSIPVLVLTGRSFEEDYKEAIKVGAEGFITKPILPNRLIQQIKRYLKE